ncbi:hypothetical protein BROUX41_003473 [Berkeleyomyces rouxiae]|uniref:uncharacterized protein n=1 Tax=Berkeleyomyces rouxiae TaxID=2035830 RepID=UPI003B798A16
MPSHMNRSASDNLSLRARGTWQRSRSTPNPQHGPQASITISDVTRSKLDQLKFKPQKAAASNDSESASTNPLGNRSDGDDSSEPTLPTNQVHETPAKWSSHRRHLIDIEEEPSPNDRLSWNTDLAAIERSASKDTPMRNRKRAASSSPTQSPYISKKDGESSTFRRLAAASKARADPTLELWDRYALHTEDSSTDGTTISEPMAQLLASSSPQPNKNPSNTSQSGGSSISSGPNLGINAAGRTVAGDHCLRRSVAMATGAKRRRVAEKNARASLLKKDGARDGKDVNSLVDVFLSNACNPALFKDSVVPAKRLDATNPLSKHNRDVLSRSASDSATANFFKTAPVAAPPKLTTATSMPALQTDEFDDLDEDMFDDDLDDETLLSLTEDTGLTTACTSVSRTVSQQAPAIQQEQASEQNHPTAQAQQYEKTQQTMENTTDKQEIEAGDEYGAEDFDDAELNLLYESTQAPEPGNAPQAPQPPQPRELQPLDNNFEAEEDFDGLDDLSGIDLDAEFATASQTAVPVQGLSHDTPPVRTTNTYYNGASYGHSPGVVRGYSGHGHGHVSNSNQTPSHSHGHTRGNPTPSKTKPRVVRRMKIVQVEESEHDMQMQKIVTLQPEGSQKLLTVFLRDIWTEPELTPGLWAYATGQFIDGKCVVDMEQNYFILEPDHLVSITTLADSFTCMRKAVLQDRVRATGALGKPLVYGTILHEIFQTALMKMDFSPEFLKGVIEETVGTHIEELFAIKIEPHTAMEEIRGKMASMRSWADNFISPVPKASAKVLGMHGNKPSNMCISKLLDIEEHVWSPMYGLKGNIDATVQVTIHDNDGMRTLTVPFEVKTGKNESISHRAQTTLYTILLSDRYDIDIDTGILYYSESGSTKAIPAIRNELVHMIMKRNELSEWLRKRPLPPMTSSTNRCRTCYAKTECAIFHRLAEDGTAESSNFPDDFTRIAGNLTPIHQTFFKKWDDLLTYEEKHGEHAKREIWAMTSAEREAVNRGFSDCIIQDMYESPERTFAKFSYTFVKRNRNSGSSFIDSSLNIYDPVVVSDEEGHFALAIGFIEDIRKDAIRLKVDRRLHNQRVRQDGFDAVHNQVFAGMNEVIPEGVRIQDLYTQADTGITMQQPVRYRIDKDEFGNGMGRVRNNLVAIMDDMLYGSIKLRQLIVDLKPPMFSPEPTQYHVAKMDTLNVDQRAAIEKVMSAQDYALVLGMPGTGKTTTIAHIIRALVAQNKTVLLTSYTHSAVDNILMKLRDDAIPILRIGSKSKVHPQVAEFASLACDKQPDFASIERVWLHSPIVATTCLGIHHPLFSERIFDYCIVDEASQITLPVCLGPIRMARTFVLVGDHYQLPPVVQNEQARLGGLDVSMFKLLSEHHPNSVVNLEHQYRMCEDIMTLSNELIYKGRLKCGTEALKTVKLHVENMDALSQHHYDADGGAGAVHAYPCPSALDPGCWLRHVVDPENRAIFLNTDALGAEARETRTGNRIINEGEVRIAVQVVEALLSIGVSQADIGVMTHYRSQLSLLGKGLGHRRNVEMYTADRFQGRDKEVVVLSLVRSNEMHNIGDLLRDWRRINVAITRSKTKLIVIGSRDTIIGAGADEMIHRFVRLMDSRGWSYTLPDSALADHMFDAAPSQFDASMFSPRRRAGPSQAAQSQHDKPKKNTVVPQTLQGERQPRGPRPVQTTLNMFGKENCAPKGAAGAPKKVVGLNGKAHMKSCPVTRDLLNEFSNGAFTNM